MLYLKNMINLVCQDSPCFNGARCGVNAGEPWKVICDCELGFKGRYCEFSDVVTSSPLRVTGKGSFY